MSSNIEQVSPQRQYEKGFTQNETTHLKEAERAQIYLAVPAWHIYSAWYSSLTGTLLQLNTRLVISTKIGYYEHH